MKSGLIQRQIKLNAQVLAGLHEEHSKLKAERKKYNEKADDYAIISRGQASEGFVDAAKANEEESKVYRDQAAIFDPYIKKFAKKIKNLEQVQKVLKGELKASQSIEAWIIEDDAFWLEQAKIAQEGGYATPDSVDALFVSFPREDA